MEEVMNGKSVALAQLKDAGEILEELMEGLAVGEYALTALDTQWLVVALTDLQARVEQIGQRVDAMPET